MGPAMTGALALISVYLLLLLALGIFQFRLMLRPPRCRSCRIPMEPMRVRDIGSPSFLVEIPYWCPRCGSTFLRRWVNLGYQ